MDPCEHEQQMDDDNRRMLGRTTELIGLRDSQPARERLAARVRNMRRIGDFQVPF
ncbi:MAG: hypothetical protein JWO07_135, partial [Candidatus Saccharibacteria bacterium]|nr:hypothetical protein [Candidatus Saccharibacteria bacterium]